MTMEERSSGIEDGAPIISTGATTNLSHNAKMKICPEMTTDASYPLQRTSKRSFDVAFLVAPDEKLIKRQHEKLVNLQQFCNNVVKPIPEDCNDDSREYEPNDRIPQNLTIKHFETIEAAHRFKTRRTDDLPTAFVPTKKRPSADLTSHVYEQKSPSPPTGAFQQIRKSFTEENGNDHILIARSGNKNDGIVCSEGRSAFTKVNLTVPRSSLMGISPTGNYEDTATPSPRSSVSPDAVTYQNSLSPPIGSPTGPFSAKYPSAFPAKMPYPFLVSPEGPQSALLDNLKLTQQLATQSSVPKAPSPKLPAGTFRPDPSGPVYPNLPYNPLSAVFPPIGDSLARPRFLAASLLPSSFAALSLPAQNVCAKCNLSFRMTSDLVYHMRSHHKSEHAGEAARRRREEKLRCPVCDESFRERHHLTRHMTAHQDKESDAVVEQVEMKRRSAAAATLVHGK